ncbi:MAG: YcxB family protein [Eubacterium sp.]|nr:YcxB family protein [Eubacterium sp.]
MEYKYEYQVQPSDLWQFHMYYTYSSYLAMINVIFIFSSVALLYALWGTSPWWLRIILLLFLSLFTVIQPLGVYIRAKKALKDQQETLRLTINEQGIEVVVGDQKEYKNWAEIQGIVIKPTLVTIYTDRSHGYILTNRILKETKKQFRTFMKAKRKSRR